MNDIQIFSSEQFGQVRTTTIGGEPWFVASDVCKALDIKDATKAMERLDNDEGGRIEIAHPQNPDKTMTVNAVNEYGLYELVLGSRKKEAKAFKRWIKHEVLPSIRKHGAYIVGQESMTREQLIAKALVAANDIIDEKDRQIAQLTETNLIQAEQIEVMSPKASYCDLVLATKDLVPITLIAKDYGMSATEMNKILHEHGYQYKRNKTWVLYDKYAGKGYTSSKTHIYEDCYGREHSQMQTQWTQSGRLFIYNELKKYGILPMVEQRLI